MLSKRTRVHKPVIRNCTLLCTLWNHVGTCEARQYLCRVPIGLKSGAPNRYRTHKWKFIVAPCVEKSHGHTEKLARLALGYEFETPGLNIAPTFSIDSVDSETVNIVGVSLAKGF